LLSDSELLRDSCRLLLELIDNVDSLFFFSLRLPFSALLWLLLSVSVSLRCFLRLRLRVRFPLSLLELEPSSCLARLFFFRLLRSLSACLFSLLRRSLCRNVFAI
jgi:hypothetical protein